MRISKQTWKDTNVTLKYGDYRENAAYSRDLHNRLGEKYLKSRYFVSIKNMYEAAWILGNGISDRDIVIEFLDGEEELYANAEVHFKRSDGLSVTISYDTTGEFSVLIMNFSADTHEYKRYYTSKVKDFIATCKQLRAEYHI